ncbi:hypothetical protein R3P38DRAFT_2981024 [Favolaschia claudopus]|uniref:Uncharacterized protein n=1 Tax=Favolaschia claudopus TaxID=2862362 RepID=A0AAW0AZR8_9AGAR
MYSAFTSSYMQPNERVRRQWFAFEQWVNTVPHIQMEETIDKTRREMDEKWNNTPARTRSSLQEHKKNKEAFCQELKRKLKAELVNDTREEWQRRLKDAGLKDEDWGNMTMEETSAVERVLSSDVVDNNGMAVLERAAQAGHQPVHSPPTAPPLVRNESRASSASGYSFVSPMSLSVADDDDEDGFQSIFANELLPSSGPESVVDEIFDTPVSVPWGWNEESSSYGIWSAATSQSSRQGSQTGSPERPQYKTMPADSTFFPRAPEPFSSLFESDPPHKTRAPRYIGPHLSDSDESVDDEEADFSRFKMDTRFAKIREFHDEAARADIQLVQDIYNARKLNTSSQDEEERIIAEHEKRMVELRRSKEEERKKAVRMERDTRCRTIRLREVRKNAAAAKVAVAAESPRERLQQEVESKLNAELAAAAPPTPVVAPAEPRRARGLSQSTVSSQSQQIRSARSGTTSELDKLTADLPHLLAAVSVTSLPTASSTPVSSNSSSTSSSNPMARWIPPPESKASVPTSRLAKKKTSPSTADSAPPPPNDVTTKPTPVVQTRKPAADPTPSVNDKPAAPTSPSKLKASVQTTPKAPIPATGSKVSAPLAPKVTPILASKVAPPPAAKAPPPAATPKAQPVPTSKASSAPVSRIPSSTAQTAPSSAAANTPSSNTLSGQSVPSLKRPSVVHAMTSPVPTSDTPRPIPKPVSSSSSSSPAVPPSAPLPSKQAPAMDIQTPGASSSRTTLEQIPRPFMHKSLGSDPRVGPPPPVPPGGGVWVSSSSAAAAAKKMEAAKASAAPATTATTNTSTASAQIDKATTNPVRLPAIAETARARRMSDPVPPSPRSFAFPPNVQGPGKAVVESLPNVTKKPSKGKQVKATRVTVEEVSDEEDNADTMETLPIDSRYIFEPKPSVPTTMFSPIIDFEPTPSSTAPPPTSIQSDKSSKSGDPRALSSESDGPGKGASATSDGKLGKDKHARWTPGTSSGENSTTRSSATGKNELQAALDASETPSSGGTKKGLRSRAGSVLQPPATVDRKGKGRAV